MPVITICSSLNFYRQVVQVQNEIESLGYECIIPASVELMKKSSDFDVSHYKTWFSEKNDYPKKKALMLGHFDEIKKSNAILVLNYDKNGKSNYIGGNVLIEMGIALFLRKPIFILNGMPNESPFLEEILGMSPIALNGKISQLPIEYEKAKKS